MEELRVAQIEEELVRFLSLAADKAYEAHRLAYVHVEDDGSFTFVCKCAEGFSERRHWNYHIRDSFKEVR